MIVVHFDEHSDYDLINRNKIIIFYVSNVK
jgi:hypothetical protein